MLQFPDFDLCLFLSQLFDILEHICLVLSCDQDNFDTDFLDLVLLLILIRLDCSRQ